MSVDNPTPDDGGASVSERIERILGGSEPQEQQETQEAPGHDPAPETPETDEAEAQEPTGDEPDESEGPQLSLSDVAKILGVEESALDVDEDGSVKVKTKIDGKEGAAKFQDLLKSYQLQGHIDAKARETAEAHRQAQERVQQFEQFAYQKAQEFEGIFQAARQLVFNEYGNVNWDDLAKNDPIGYVEKKHAYDARIAQLQQIKAAADHEAYNFQQQQAQRHQHLLQSEMQRLSTLVPEWTDASKRNEELPKLVSWLKSQGARDETIQALDQSVFADAGLIRALRAGMLAEANKPKVQAVQKMVRAAPKLVKPGQSTDAGQRQAESVKSLRQQVRQSGGKGGSVAAYLMATGKV